MQQCGVLMSTVAHQASQQAWHVGALEEAFGGIGLTHFNKLPLETDLYVCACACVYLCSHAKPANSWEFTSNDLQTGGDIVRVSARCRKLWLVSSRMTAVKGRGRCRVVDN